MPPATGRRFLECLINGRHYSKNIHQPQQLPGDEQKRWAIVFLMSRRCRGRRPVHLLLLPLHRACRAARRAASRGRHYRGVREHPFYHDVLT